MKAPREEWTLETRRLGRRVLVFDRVDSTNSVAASFADDPSQDGLAVLAGEQTAGRGQHGRTWLAPPGSSVLLSVLLWPPQALRRPAVLTAWAAVSVCEVVHSITGIEPQIKWPNDVLLGGRKVCGILIEQIHGSGRLATVVGIGLNVCQRQTTLLATDLTQATSLIQFSDIDLNPHEIARDLLRRLDAAYDSLCVAGWRRLEQSWRDYLGLFGQSVTAECVGATHRGRLVSLGFDEITLERPGLTSVRLTPEMVLHLAPAP